MMIKASLISTAAGFALTTAAVADFTNYSGVVTTIDEFTVINVYANFDDPNNALLNIYGADVTTADAGGFYHNDAGGGTWKPNLSLDIPGFADSSRDSYVTVGYGVGVAAPTNSTALDPSFGSGAGPFIPLDAGWYNGNPDDAQYGPSVHVGQFVFETARAVADGTAEFFVFDCEGGYNNGPGSGETFFHDDRYTWGIPTPGALALLGMGGLVARRRRA